jgi:hypothetical protein
MDACAKLELHSASRKIIADRASVWHGTRKAVELGYNERIASSHRCEGLI